MNSFARQLRWGLGLFVLLLTYDGALRKWGLPAAEQILFILKDVLLLGLLMLVLSKSSRGAVQLPDTIKQLFMLYAFWVTLEVFNLHSPNLFVGVWGLKSHLLYASLIIVLPRAFHDLTELLGALERIYPWVVVPVCLVAFSQLVAGGESALNQQVRGGTEGLSYFGEQNLVRVAGTFSYITGMGAFVQFVSLLGVGLYLAGARSWIFLVGLAFAMMVLPVTGSRAVLFVPLAGFVLMIAAAWQWRLMSGKRVLQAGVLMLGLMVVSMQSQDTAWEALQQRIDANREEGSSRMVTAFTNAFAHMETAGLFGFGTGTANLGAVALTPGIKPFSWLPGYFEEESGRIVLELGMIGWFLSLWLRVGLLLFSFSLLRDGMTRTVKAAAMMALPFIAFGVHSGNGVFAASYMAVGYWLMVAILAMAYREQRRLKRERRSNHLMRSQATSITGAL